MSVIELEKRRSLPSVSGSSRADLQKRHCLVLVHQFDPRGDKVGGVETHVRLLMRNFPEDMDVVVIGMDERGDLALGKPIELESVGDRRFLFVPVARNVSADVSGAARTIMRSVTARFAIGLARHVRVLRQLLAGRAATLELQRAETAFLPRLLGIPAVSMVHFDYARESHADSLTARFSRVNGLSEAMMVRESAEVVLVNHNMRDRYAETHPRAADKFRVMPVPVDTAIFQPTPLDTSDSVLRLVYTGRLADVKDPDLMFATIGLLKDLLPGGVEFNYIGTSRPQERAAFADIAAITVQHGFQHAPGIARIVSRCHMGILTSHAEGMPCFVLEVLAAGRSIASVSLPQLTSVVRPREAGTIVDRDRDPRKTATALAAAIVAQWQDIRSGHYDPVDVAARAMPYSACEILPNHFERHRSLSRPLHSRRVVLGR